MEILSDATFKGNLSICGGYFNIFNKSGRRIIETNETGISEFGNSISSNGISVYTLFLNGNTIYSCSLKEGRDFGYQHILQKSAGTIAHTSDIPDTSNFALKSEVDDVKYVMLKYGKKLIDFDVPSDCTLFKVGPIYSGSTQLNGLSTYSASMIKYIEFGDPNELDPNKQLCYTKFANFAELMPANDGYVYINKASGYSISASDKYAVSLIWWNH